MESQVHQPESGHCSENVEKTLPVKRYKPRVNMTHSKQLSRYDLEQIVNASMNAIRIINKDFTIHYINQSFADMSGITTTEAIGQKCWEVFPSPFCHTPECRLARILNGETMIQAEIERYKKDGTRIPCIVNAIPFYSDNKDILGVIETFTDITEKKQLKQQAEESEERYRALIELGSEAGEAIVMLQDIDGQEGIQTFVSDQWLKITGYSKEEMLSMSFFDLVSPKDRAASLERHRKKMSGKAVPGLYEMDIIRKDGRLVPIELTGGSTPYGGKRANVLYIRDITQRKLIEDRLRNEKEKYQSIFDNIPLAVCEVDYSGSKHFLDELIASGITDFDKYFDEHPNDIIEFEKRQKVLSSNKACSTLYEKDGPWEADSKNDISALELSRGNVKNQIKIILEHKKTALLEILGGQRQRSHEGTIVTAKGNVKNIKFWHSVALGHEQDLSRVFITIVDITDRVKAENELNKYKENLEEIITQRTMDLKQSLGREQELCKKLELKSKQQIDFIRRLVHDLKTPLFPMLSVSQMLMEQAQDENSKQMALNINRGAKKLSSSISDLIDVMRGEIGVLQLECAKTDITKLITEAVEFFAYEAQRKNQVLLLDNSKELPIIWADPERLTQVVMNLLENALRYTPSGGSISVQAQVKTGNVIVDIVDSGPGIKEADIPFIFEPYYSTTKRSTPSGLGLGLPLAKTLIELHNGNIWVKNRLNGGADVGFSIPMRPAPKKTSKNRAKIS
jgi:PAS domain S-box-containing protein